MSRAPDTSPEEQDSDARPGEGDGSTPRPLDAVFEVLTARRRRCALYVLSRATDRMTLSDLASEVASLEDADYDRVVASLYHVHLPKLAAVGVVDYDGGDGTVSLADCSGRLHQYLAIAAENERRSLRRTRDGPRSEF